MLHHFTNSLAFVSESSTNLFPWKIPILSQKIILIVVTFLILTFIGNNTYIDHEILRYLCHLIIIIIIILFLMIPTIAGNSTVSVDRDRLPCLCHSERHTVPPLPPWHINQYRLFNQVHSWPSTIKKSYDKVKVPLSHYCHWFWFRTASEKLNFIPFPKLLCFLSNYTLFFPVDNYSSLNGPFLKKTYPLNVDVCCTLCFLTGTPLKSVRFHSKSHQKSSMCLIFLRAVIFRADMLKKQTIQHT